MTDDEFAQIVRVAEGFWPNKPFPENTLDLWWAQMDGWQFDLMMLAMPKLARELHWLPSFSQIAEAYRLEVRMAAPRAIETHRHLSAISDPALSARWARIISARLRGSSMGSLEPDNTPIARAVRPHYRRDDRGIVVIDGAKMLVAAEAALADEAFGASDA